jgi:hypothetical protein
MKCESKKICDPKTLINRKFYINISAHARLDLTQFESVPLGVSVRTKEFIIRENLNPIQVTLYSDKNKFGIGERVNIGWSNKNISSPLELMLQLEGDRNYVYIMSTTSPDLLREGVFNWMVDDHDREIRPGIYQLGITIRTESKGDKGVFFKSIPVEVLNYRVLWSEPQI